MKITEIRTRVVQWKGKTTPLPPHFCTNPMDLIAPSLSPETMGTFTFHGWLICEVMTDTGLVGIGNAALSPLVTKQVIDLYLKPLLIGTDPWDIEFLWQHMYRKTLAFGRKGIAMVAISAVTSLFGICLGSPPNNRYTASSADARNRKFPFTPAGSTRHRSTSSPAKRLDIKTKAIKQ